MLVHSARLLPGAIGTTENCPTLSLGSRQIAYGKEELMHAPHEGPGRVLYDNCDECVARAIGGLDGLSHLDNGNLKELAKIAVEKMSHPRLVRPLEGCSYADMKAVETLRLASRLVERSGIPAEAGR